MSSRITEQRAAEAIKEMSGKSVLILTHRRPDGDTLGSALALKEILKELGGRADIACSDAVPSNCRFLFKETELPLQDPDPEKYEMLVSVDVASRSQLGGFAALAEKISLRIDHHAVGEDYAAENCVDPDAAACAELILRIARIIGIPDERIMTPIYAAVSSDTGGFRYSNTTGRTMRVGADMMDAGADCGYINHMLFDNHTYSEIRAIRTAYENIGYHEGGKIAIITVTKKAKEENGLCDEDLGVISSLARDIDGVVLGIVLKQDGEDEKKYRVSMRSTEPIDVARICMEFGGGGHVRAAGGEIEAEKPEDAVRKILEIVKKYEKF